MLLLQHVPTLEDSFLNVYRQQGACTDSFMSQNCNESTIRHAADSGWAVEYLHDAAGVVSYRNKMGLLDTKTMHEASCVVLQSKYAAVMTTSEWIALIRNGQAAPREGLYQSYLNAR